LNTDILESTGIYIVYPTSPTLKSIYRAKHYKTKVNDQHIKVGIAKESFRSRKSGYLGNFDSEVEFLPFILMRQEFLENAERKVIAAIRTKFSRVGHSREWFNTSNIQEITKIIAKTLLENNIEHERIDLL
jgi:hypothetical protein